MDATTIEEPARRTPVACEVDLCVVGGSCTGVFAAVAAARLGLSVALIEVGGQFGGNTTLGFVSVWHSLWNVSGERQIIAGLTQELVRRLQARGVVVEKPRADPNWQYALPPAEVACALDELVDEHGIRAFLHARVVAAAMDAGRVAAAIIEDKDGRRAVRAAAFVDASGDADLVRLAGGETFRAARVQPPTTAAIVSGIPSLRRAVPGFRLARTVFDPADPQALPPGFLWSFELPGGGDIEQVFGTRVHGAFCASADELTRAEIEGRRQARRIVDALRRRHPGHPLTLVALPSRIGVRETRHAVCRHRLRERELLAGARFDDAIANGSYRVDVHRDDGAGLTFRYLDGREIHLSCDDVPSEGRWRAPQAVDPTFYQIPFRSLTPAGIANVLVAGRCLDADPGAFGAVRVQVTCNQMGEAAGTAAALARRSGVACADVDIRRLRDTLAAQGAAVI